jgi:hypothetical protein
MAGYPSFAPLFQRSRYLTFITPRRRDPGVVEALDALDGALRTSTSIVHEISALLRDLNWRPNLVAAAAVARAGMGQGPVLRELWLAIDRPSWVSPQLAAATSIVDPRFADGARARSARATGKTATALAALAGLPPPPGGDPESGAATALAWRDAMIARD